MKINILILCVFSQFAFCQSLIPDPLPGCDNIQRVGIDQGGVGYSTMYWVEGYGVTSEDCDGIAIQVSGEMYSGDFAYAIVGVEDFSQSTVEEVDFSVDLSDVFVSLSYGQEITILELYSDETKIGDVSIRKVLSVLTSNGKGNQVSSSPTQWVVKVKWINVINNSEIEHEFTYNEDEVIEFNYIWDANGPQSTISMISLGSNRFSIYPDPNNHSGLVPLTNVTGEVDVIFMGIINDNVLLIDGDRISFDINFQDQIDF